MPAGEKETIDPQEQEELPRYETGYPHQPDKWTLHEILKVLKEDGYDRSGVCVLLPEELRESREDFAAELPVPILDLETRTLYKIKHLLHQGGFPRHGILVLNVCDRGEDDGAGDDRNQTEEGMLSLL